MDPQMKKSVLRLFSYGLYVISARSGSTWNAFTANWVAQVSFAPPLLAASVERDAATLALIRESGRLAIGVLARGQREIAGQLGRSIAQRPDKLEGLAWLPEPNPPVLADCLGYVVCRLLSETPAGDSVLLVAEVIEAALLREGEPLTMREAGYRHSG